MANLKTYQRIKDFFVKNKDGEFTPAKIRNKLGIDYYSVKFVLVVLIKDKFIKEIPAPESRPYTKNPSPTYKLSQSK